MADDCRVVISMHGIRTRGVWQKDLVPELAIAGFIPYALDYGDFGAFKLLSESKQNKRVDELVKEYDRIRADSCCERPSVIAHSFGTLQVAHLLLKYHHVIFDKVILAASIIDTNFDWPHMLDTRRVNWVVNDYGGKDIWPKVARRYVPSAGASGAEPFTRHHRALHQVPHPYHRHSSYFSQGNFRCNWVPTLTLDKRSIIDALHGLIGILAGRLSLKRDMLRCLILQIDAAGANLKAVPGLHIGRFSLKELDTSISLDAIGPGAGPAAAFNEMRETRQSEDDLNVLRESYGGVPPFPDQLKWSLASPVPLPSDYEKAIGVLIVDGLETPQNELAKALFEEDDSLEVLVQLGDLLGEGLWR